MKEKDIFDNLTEESAGDKNVSSELLELSKKIDVLQGQMNAALELFKKDDVLTEIGDIYEDSDEGSMEDTSDNILDATIGVDIEKAVKDILKNNPRDVGSAQRKIRVCIENYCRYKKGIDLNDSLFFKLSKN